MQIEDETVTLWIHQLAEGDDRAAEKIYQRYFAQLVRYARSRISPALRTKIDEEEIVNSAMKSFLMRHRSGKFPDMESRDNLWRLLLTITARKISKRVAKAQASPVTEADLPGETSSVPGLSGVIGRGGGPVEAAMVEEFLNLLPDQELRTIALLKLDGHTNERIKELLGFGNIRRVERRLRVIRNVLTVELSKIRADE